MGLEHFLSFPLMNKSPQKVLLILSCTKRKLSHPAPAISLYQGDIFKKGVRWARRHNFDIAIISAKHGLVMPDEVLKPYNRRINNIKEAHALRESVLPTLNDLLPRYGIVILIMGNLYLETLRPAIEAHPQISFYKLKGERGIFDYKKNIGELLRDNLDVLDAINHNSFSLKILKDFLLFSYSE